MPNWVYCTLRISGDPENVSDFRNQIVNNEIFNSLLPTPQELNNTPATFHEEKDYTDQEKANIEKYGAKDWYHWNYVNLGTKWPDFKTELIAEDTNFIEYQTHFAWYLPMNGMNTISKRFPDLVFHFLDVEEESRAFAGSIAWKGGLIIDNQLHECDDDEDMDYSYLLNKSWLGRQI
ncbi:MAG: hypothetical protein WCK35_19000 [Chloroflexota bacterium]